MPFYLSEYIGSGTREDPFRPVGSDQPGWSSIDLRPDPSRLDGGGLNVCLLHVPTTFSDPRAIFICGDKLENLSNPMRNFIENRLGITIGPETTFADIVGEFLSNPPPGKWNPLRAGKNGRREVWLGGLLWSKEV